MTTAEGVHQAVREATTAGLCVLPPSEDGKKRPQPDATGKWKDFEKRLPSEAELRRWYPGRSGLGAVCGAISGNLEVIDFDERDDYDTYVELARQAGLGELVARLEEGYVEDTPHGVHWLYRCATIAGNLELARRPIPSEHRKSPGEKVKAFIETRGEGGYIILAPTNGKVNPAGPYLRRAGSFATIPTITPEERLDLHRLARALDEMPTVEAHAPASVPKSVSGHRPGDDYIRRTTWADVIEPHGWQAVYTHGDVTHWRRPGKDRGTSATTNFGGSDFLIVFSSSTPFETCRGYNRFSAYALLNHGGNVTDAARELGAKGYGEPPRASGATTSGPDTSGQAHAESGTQQAAPDAPWWETGPAFARHADTPAPTDLVEHVLPGDGFTLWHGDPRTFKTWHAEDSMLSLVAGVPALGGLSTAGPVPALYVSNEDPARRTADRLVKLARGKGLPGLPEHLFLAVHSGLWLDDEPSQAKLIALVKREGIRLVVLDPLRSLTAGVDQGPRDLQPFARFLRLLMTCSGCAVLGLHHDVKPLAGVSDTRKRAHRASGGGLFSIADAPVHFERVGDDPTVILHPSGWKHSDTPGPLETRLVVTEDGATLTATATTHTSASDRELHAKILDFLTAHPDTSGNKIATGLRARREVVTRALEDLATAGKVDSRRGPRGAQNWFRLDDDRFRGEDGSDAAGQVS